MTTITTSSLLDADEGLHKMYDLYKSRGLDTSEVEVAHHHLMAEFNTRSLIHAKALSPKVEEEQEAESGFAGLEEAGLADDGDADNAKTVTIKSAIADGWVIGDVVTKRDYSVEQRQQMAEQGHALPDGSFPIGDERDLHNSIRLHHLAADPVAARDHIINRARSMGLDHAVPEDWTAGEAPKSGKPANAKPAGAASSQAAGNPQPVDEEDVADGGADEAEEDAKAKTKKARAHGPSVIDGFVIEVVGKALDVDLDMDYAVVKSVASRNYTLGPVYMPDTLDAHGEWTDADELQKSVWDYVRKADRTVFLQHSAEPAGEWVEIMAWPQEVTANMISTNPVTKARETVRKATFPAGTVYMGIVWKQWAMDAIRTGKLNGLSMGGRARRVEADITKAAGTNVASEAAACPECGGKVIGGKCTDCGYNGATRTIDNTGAH